MITTTTTRARTGAGGHRAAPSAVRGGARGHGHGITWARAWAAGAPPRALFFRAHVLHRRERVLRAHVLRARANVLRTTGGRGCVLRERAHTARMLAENPVDLRLVRAQIRGREIPWECAGADNADRTRPGTQSATGYIYYIRACDIRARARP